MLQTPSSHVAFHIGSTRGNIPPPDTRCKQTFDCKKLNNITYQDFEGNTYCGRRYKHSEDNALHTWTYKECHALLKKAEQQDTSEELPF